MTTNAESAFSEALEETGITVLDVDEREDGEFRVIHQLAESDDETDVQETVRQIVGLFTGVYAGTSARYLVAAAISADEERAITYHCKEPWAANAAQSNPDPSAATEARIAAMAKAEQTIDGPLSVDDVDELLSKQ